MISQVPSSNDRLPRELEEFYSRLDESGHRFNSRYAQQKQVGKTPKPQATVRYLTKMYNQTAAMAVEQVKDYVSALGWTEELDVFLKKLLKLSSKLLRSTLPREHVASSQAELRRRLLSRSEHWKAEAYKRVRSGTCADKLRAPNQPTVTHCQILLAAMQRQGLTAPNLAVKIRALLKRRGVTKLKVDRSTIYRIVAGATKKPLPAVRNALIEVLQLEGEEASTVRRALTRTASPLTSAQTKSRKQ